MTSPELLHALAKVKLPAPKLRGEISVEEALSRRRSVRSFVDSALSLEDVAQVLWAAYGVNRPARPGSVGRSRKTAPSAGALYPLEVYLVAGKVSSLAPGVYHYLPEPHELERIIEGDRRGDLCEAALQQAAVSRAPISLVFSAVYGRTTGKYGERGRERYVCTDLGHAGENVCLECCALGLGTVPIGAFSDAGVKAVVGMTREEVPVYIMPVGKPEE